MAIFRAITPEVEPLSLDEAFLDVSGAVRRLGPPRAIAELIRAQVLEQQSITCSVGVAPVKFVAKIASARCKPDGLLVVPADGLLDFLHPLPVGALGGWEPTPSRCSGGSACARWVTSLTFRRPPCAASSARPVSICGPWRGAGTSAG